MRPKVTILMNPHAGARTNAAPAVAEAMHAAGAEPTVTESDGSSLYENARNALRDDGHIIVAAGGDGTVSTVASALAGTDRPLGVLPLGTLNHFAKDLGMPQDLEGAARTIAEGHTVLVDVGEVNGRTFINNSGVGAYPHLVTERRARQKHHARWFSDLMAALNVLREYRRLAVEVRSGDMTRYACTPFVFVGNNEYQLEGLRFGARPSLDQGTLHVCMAPDISRAGFVRLVASALIGRLNGNTRFETLSLPAFLIRADRRRLLVSLDGEVVLLETPLKYRIRRRALRVIVPATSAVTDSGRSVA